MLSLVCQIVPLYRSTFRKSSLYAGDRLHRWHNQMDFPSATELLLHTLYNAQVNAEY